MEIIILRALSLYFTSKLCISNLINVKLVLDKNYALFVNAIVFELSLLEIPI